MRTRPSHRLPITDPPAARAPPEDYVRNVGLRCNACGPGIGILEGHASRGFSRLSESALGLCLRLMGHEEPEASQADIDRATDFQMACLAAQAPGLADTEVAARLHAGFLDEHPAVYDDLAVPAHLLAEVVTAPEAKQVAKYARELKEMKAKRAHVAATVSARMGAYPFSKTGEREWSTAQKKKPRWLAKSQPETVATASAWIRARLPERCRIHEDPKAGRWKVLGPGGAHRSVAWTERGFRRAAGEALLCAWQFWRDATGKAPPVDYQAWIEELDQEGLPPLPGAGPSRS